MTSYVLDAGVAAKWFLPAASETLSDEADRLLRGYTKAEVGFLVPDLFFPELANILWKAGRARRCDAATADAALSKTLNRGFHTVPSVTLVQDALQLARTFDRTAYDCIYIALAIQTNTQLITADEKLANAVAGRLPVTWLGLF